MYRVTTFACALLLVSCLYAKPVSLNDCDSRLSLASPLPRNVAEVSDLSYTVQLPASRLEFSFKNNGTKAIVRVFMLIELVDMQQQSLFTMTLHAYKRGAPGWPTDAPPSGIQLDRPLNSGETERWWISSPLLALSCPASTRATMIRIQFEDGSEYRYTSSEARQQPQAIDASHADLRGMPLQRPLQLVATLRIDTNGRAHVTHVDRVGANIEKWLQGVVDQWEFLPQLEAGVPSSGDLNVLFRIHESVSAHYPVPEFLPQTSPFEIIDVIPTKQNDHSWQVLIGGTVISSKAFEK